MSEKTQTLETVEIAGKTYPIPRLNHFNRKQMRMFKDASQSRDFEMFWDVVSVLLPEAPQDDVDNMTVDECLHLIRLAGEKLMDEDMNLGESSN